MAANSFPRFQGPQDSSWIFKDAGLVAASAAATVGGSAAVIDTGSASAITEAKLVVDCTACEVASGDEYYRVIVQGSSSATFASDIRELGAITLGDTVGIGGGVDVDNGIGRYTVGIRNEQGGKVYRYLRVYTVVGGAIATGGGVNFTAWATKQSV